MTRFFFHVRGEDGDISRDLEGQDLPGLDAACQEALNTNREMLGERLLHGGSLDNSRIEITDEQGDILAVLNSKDTLLQEGHIRAFSDDVTKSAPIAEIGTSSSKPGPR